MVSSAHKLSSQTPSPIVSSRDLGWKSLVVEEFQQPPGSGEVPAEDKHVLALCLASKPHRIWQTVGDRSYSGIYQKGDLSITPAQISGSYKAYGNDRYLQIAIPPHLLQQVATEALDLNPDRLELNTEFRVRNPQIEQLAMMLRAELHQGKDGVGQLYIESLTNALIVNLLRDYAGTRTSIAIYPGGLSDRSILQVTEYIDNHLTETIKLDDLATVLGISKFHFSKMFKQSTGMSPHQYVMQQRIERAKQLLKTEDMSIADVALDCGFNSHGHLGKYFRTFTGMTPKAFRRC